MVKLKNENIFSQVMHVINYVFICFLFVEETNSLMKMLVQFNYDGKANQLQDLLSKFIVEVQGSLSTIWIYNSGGNHSNMVNLVCLIYI